MRRMNNIFVSSNNSNVKTVLFNRPKDSHKGTFGHVLILAGSPGLMGAAFLSSLSALRSGCGLVTLGVPKSQLLAAEIKLTEVIKRPLPETKNKTLSLKSFSVIKKIHKNYKTAVLGPGLSRDKETSRLIRKLIAELEIPLLIDADAVNALENNISVLRKINCPLVLTPHPAEMGRLIKKTVHEVQAERENLAKTFSKEFNVTLVLKGYKSIVSSKRDFYINDTGNSGLATAGSGDVLAGMIASFMAQGIENFEAAKWGVYIHGLAGDLAAQEKGEISLIAGDIIDYLPLAFEKVRKSF